MRRLASRWTWLAILILSCALIGTLFDPAQAEEITGSKSSLSLTWITTRSPTDPNASGWPDISRSFTPRTASFNGAVSANGGRVDLAVVSKKDSSIQWDLGLAAAPGKKLVVGKHYTGAMRLASQTKGHAAFELTGEGRGCGTISASFTITQLKTGKNGWIQDFRASYLQKCDGAATSQGVVAIHNGPPPPALKIMIQPTKVTLSPVNGYASVTASITCNRKAYLTDIEGSASQPQSGVSGHFDAVHVVCDPKVPAWTSFLEQNGGLTLTVPGSANISGTFSPLDPAYYPYITLAECTFSATVPVVFGDVTPPT
jgi:hypothetical protein